MRSSHLLLHVLLISLPISGSDAYDLQTLTPPSDAIVRGDELWFCYGTNMANAFISSGTPHEGGAVHLAELRRDGFISLGTGETEGTLLTQPFTLPGRTLRVNVDAPRRPLHVEVLEGNGQVVARSYPLSSDLLREPAKWAKGGTADLMGQTVSLRFTLRNAQVYSYWIEYSLGFGSRKKHDIIGRGTCIGQV